MYDSREVDGTLTSVKCVRGRHDDSVAGDPHISDLEPLGRRLALQARGHRWVEAEGLVDAGLQVRELSQGPVVNVVFIGGVVDLDGVDLLLEGLVDVWVRGKVVEEAGQGRCCGVAVMYKMISIECVCVNIYI